MPRFGQKHRVRLKTRGRRVPRGLRLAGAGFKSFAVFQGYIGESKAVIEKEKRLAEQHQGAGDRRKYHDLHVRG